MRPKLQWIPIGLCILIAAEIISRQLDGQFDNDSLFNFFFYDEQLLRRDMIQKGGFFRNGIEARVNSRGFRDAKTWPPRPDSTRHRIVLAGAGHGYAENLGDGLIYAHILEESLQKTEPNVEVHNVSVQGSTVLFFERALLHEVIQVKPDVVILSYSGFNEALYTSLPEASVLFPHNTVYNALMSSSLVRRIHLFFFAQPQKTNRLTPVEMIESYRRILQELKKHDIAVLILLQAVIHPDIDGLWRLSDMDTYRQQLNVLAAEQQIPIADPFSFCPEVELCFEDAEWYSQTGHQAAAKSLEQYHPFLLGK